MAWCYRLKYDGHNHYDDWNKPFLSYPDPTEAARYSQYLIDLHIAACKYQMIKLKIAVWTYLPKILTVVASLKDSSLPLGEVARHLYLDTAESGAAIRPLIVGYFVNDIVQFSDVPAFGQMLLDIPELSAEIVQGLAAKAKEAVPPTNKRPAESAAVTPSTPLAGRFLFGNTAPKKMQVYNGTPRHSS